MTKPAIVFNLDALTADQLATFGLQRIPSAPAPSTDFILIYEMLRRAAIIFEWSAENGAITLKTDAYVVGHGPDVRDELSIIFTVDENFIRFTTRRLKLVADIPVQPGQ